MTCESRQPIFKLNDKNMKDTNIVILAGRVGENVKFGTATNGNKYCTFILEIDAYSRDMHDSTERDYSKTLVRIFVYDKVQLNYLERVGIKQGNFVQILARLNSHKTEVGSKNIIQNSVIVRDISIIKTSL